MLLQGDQGDQSSTDEEEDPFAWLGVSHSQPLPPPVPPPEPAQLPAATLQQQRQDQRQQELLAAARAAAADPSRPPPHSSTQVRGCRLPSDRHSSLTCLRHSVLKFARLLHI